MADYRPPTRFDTRVTLLIPIIKTYNGVSTTVYPASGPAIWCSFRSFGGTETAVNGVYSVEKTAVVETWYNSSIRSDCQIRLDGFVYEILGEPEDINRRHQFMRFKVRHIGGRS